MTTAQPIKGSLNGAGKKFALVAGRFNEYIVDSLVNGARNTLEQHGVAPEDIMLVQVPGCFELPLAVRQVVRSQKNLAGVVALGAVIRGATPHFDYVAGECASGIRQVSMELDLPVGFGVLTTETIEQRLSERALKPATKAQTLRLPC